MPAIYVKSTKKKLVAEMWDKMQYLFRNYYDRMVHVAFYYDGKVNVDALTHAVGYILNKVPILHSSFVNSLIRPYWKVNNTFDPKDIISVIDTIDTEKTINEFLTQEIKAQEKYQLKVSIIRNGGKDTVCMLMNHMCMDGGDAKQLVKILFQAYNLYVNNKIIDVEVKSGDRSHYQVYTNFDERDKQTALSLYKNVSEVKDKTKFPFTANGKDTGRIVRHKISRDNFLKMKVKGKEAGATINEVILASYMRALYKVCDIKREERLSVPCMVDLRRHIAGGNSYGFSNHVGFMINTLDRCDDNIVDSVKKVKDISIKAKDEKYLGLYSLPLLNLAYKVFPQFIAETAIRIGYSNPFTGMSNIGIINEKDYAINGLKLVNAWMTGAIKKKPYMQLALTTFREEITLSIAVKCNDKDEEIIRNFLKLVEEEIIAFISSK